MQVAIAYLRTTSSVDPMDEVNWQAVNEFARRTLWNRVWIVQEVSLAKRAVVLCGPERMLLEDLYVFRKLRIALFAEATTATAQKQHGRHRFLAVLASSIGHVSIFMDLRMALQSLKTTVSNNSMAVLEFTTETSFDLGTTPIVNNFTSFELYHRFRSRTHAIMSTVYSSCIVD